MTRRIVPIRPRKATVEEKDAFADGRASFGIAGLDECPFTLKRLVMAWTAGWYHEYWRSL